jgi:hypothetical protein
MHSALSDELAKIIAATSDGNFPEIFSRLKLPGEFPETFPTMFAHRFLLAYFYRSIYVSGYFLPCYQFLYSIIYVSGKFPETFRKFPETFQKFSETPVRAKLDYAHSVLFGISSVSPSLTQWRSQGFQSGGLRGRVREGCTPSRRGPRGYVPGKIFKLQMHAGEFKSIFQTKINTLTNVFMPVSFAKIFKLQMHAGEF